MKIFLHLFHQTIAPSLGVENTFLLYLVAFGENGIAMTQLQKPFAIGISAFGLFDIVFRQIQMHRHYYFLRIPRKRIPQLNDCLREQLFRSLVQLAIDLRRDRSDKATADHLHRIHHYASVCRHIIESLRIQSTVGKDYRLGGVTLQKGETLPYLLRLLELKLVCEPHHLLFEFAFYP